MPPACPSSSEGDAAFARLRGLAAHLRGKVLGQPEAVGALADLLLAGELGHTPPARPRSFALLLGPTGTGKTKSVLEASAHLFGTRTVARINVAEFSSGDRVPLLLGTAAGEEGILGREIARMRSAGGRILLLDEIEKGHRTISDLFLGMEAAELTLANGTVLDLSDVHVLVTSNLGTADAIALEDVAYASLRRFIEDEAMAHFRPEVFARFTAVLVFRPLAREVQLDLGRRLLEEELSFQSDVLSRRFGHPHVVGHGPGVFRKLASEGFHRTLGARPMRNVIERRVRAALVRAQLDGTIAPGMARSELGLDPTGGLLAFGVRPVRLREPVPGGGDEVIVN